MKAILGIAVVGMALCVAGRGDAADAAFRQQALTAARAVKAGQYDQALKKLRPMLQRYPKASDIDLIHWLTCKAYIGKKNYKAAVGQCSAAIKRNAKNANFYLDRGQAYYRLGDAANAKRDLVMALKKGSSKAMTHGLLARLAWRAGDSAAAETQSDLALKRDAKNADALAVKAEMRMARRLADAQPRARPDLPPPAAKMATVQKTAPKAPAQVSVAKVVPENAERRVALMSPKSPSQPSSSPGAEADISAAQQVITIAAPAKPPPTDDKDETAVTDVAATKTPQPLMASETPTPVSDAEPDQVAKTNTVAPADDPQANRQVAAILEDMAETSRDKKTVKSARVKSGSQPSWWTNTPPIPAYAAVSPPPRRAPRGWLGALDCAAPRGRTESLICSDRRLRREARTLDLLFWRARDMAAAPQAMEADQRDWITQVRNRCRTRSCLDGVYADRRLELMLWIGD